MPIFSSARQNSLTSAPSLGNESLKTEIPAIVDAATSERVRKKRESSGPVGIATLVTGLTKCADAALFAATPYVRMHGAGNIRRSSDRAAHFIF